MDGKTIALGENNTDDEPLTLCPFMQGNIVKKIIVAQYGVDAPAYLFGTGSYEGHTIRNAAKNRLG